MARESISISVGGKLADNTFTYVSANHGIPSTVDTVAAADAAAILAAALTGAQADIATAKTDTAAAKVATAAAKVSTDAAKTSATTADTDAGTAKTDALATQVAAVAAQTGIVALTPLTNAIATAKATPNQTNVDAIDTIYNTAVTGVHDAILTLDGLINATKNASDTGATSATAAKASTATAKTNATTADTNAGTADTAAGTADTWTGQAKIDVDALDATDVVTNLAAHAIDESADIVVDWNTAKIVNDSELNDVLRKVVSTAQRGY